MADTPQTKGTDPINLPAARETPRTELAQGNASLLSNVLAIVGLIIFVVLIIWGLVHLASLSKSWFSSLFPRSVPSIEVTAPASVTSGDAFLIRWKYATNDKGAYAFLYQCKTGLRFETPAVSGAMNQIPCGAAFILPATSDTLSLTPVFSGNTSTNVPLSISFTPNATSSAQAQGSVSIVVNPGVAGSAPVAQAATAPKPRSTGPADLAVRIIAVTADQSGSGIATFDISNAGSGSSGVYYFTAQLPTSAYAEAAYYGAPSQGSYTYTSPAQVSLAPGDHIQSTLRFTGAHTGGIFSVTVDPSSTVNDSNRTNNYAYQSLIAVYQSQPYYTY